MIIFTFESMKLRYLFFKFHFCLKSFKSIITEKSYLKVQKIKKRAEARFFKEY
jgi:hypothetical protein